MAESIGFSIARRAVGDPELHDHKPYPTDSAEYTCIATPLSIALSILEQDHSKEVLTHLALLFDNVASNSASFARDEAAARRWTSWFVVQLRANPPTMIVDENLGRPMLDVMGYHPRTVWNGSLDQFPFRWQSVHLNAERVKSMIAAKRNMSSRAGPRFFDFQFAFITTIVHEFGSIFITWLGKGNADTPRITSGVGCYTEEIVGELEAGRFLEMCLFGGATTFWQNPSMDDDQLGEAYHIDKNGWAWRISPDAINEVCMFKFTFPLARTDEGAVNPFSRERMTRSSDTSAA